MNKLLLTTLLLLALISLASTHRHRHGKRGRGPKKMIKVIKVGGAREPDVHHHHHHYHGPVVGAPKPPVASSSSSSSSEEVVNTPDFDVELETTTVAPPTTVKPTTVPTTTVPTTTVPTTTAAPKCENGWLEFQRPHGLWCVLVGNKGGNNHQLTQPEAEKICKQHQATLTGIQNDEERMEIAKEAIHQLGEIKMEMGAVWLGAKTVDACKTTSCGPFNTFQWTDGSANGSGGFKWGLNEPDNEAYPGNHACIQQIVFTSTFEPETDEEKEMRKNFKSGDLDKYKCESPEHPKTRLFACGRKAQ